MNEPLRTCIDCGLEAHTEADLELFVKRKSRKHGRENRCKSCHAKGSQKWKAENKERHLEYNKQWYNKNKERVAEYGKQWRIENRERLTELSKQWKQDNPDKCNAYTAKRRATKLQATPPWFDREKRRIEFLYTTAQLKGLHVDHIVPLQHELACGLHTVANLQLLTPEENRSKSNNFEI